MEVMACWIDRGFALPMAEPTTNFGRWLRAARKRKKWSQRKLGELAELDRLQVGRVELGRQKTKISTAVRLATALNESPKDAVDALGEDYLPEDDTISLSKCNLFVGAAVNIVETGVKGTLDKQALDMLSLYLKALEGGKKAD